MGNLLKANMMYYHIYLYHGNKYNYHCVITQTLQNGPCCSSLHLGLWDINISIYLSYLHHKLLLFSLEQYHFGLIIYKIRSIHPLSMIHIGSQNHPLIPPPFQFYTVHPLSLYIWSWYCPFIPPFQFPNYCTFDPKIIIKSPPLNLNFYPLSFDNQSTLVWGYCQTHWAFTYL